MTRLAPLHLLFALLALACSGAQAQLFRTYLSGAGNDANPCTLQAPCRLLPAALSAVADRGEIWMLDSANFNTGTVDISKSVSILAVPGAVGSLMAIAGAPAVAITTPGLNIALRNVVIAGLVTNNGTHGILMSADSSLIIENSLIRGLNADGIRAQGPGNLTISNTNILFNTGFGVRLENGARASIFASNIERHNAGGVSVFGNVDASQTLATVSDSIISGFAAGGANIRARAEAAGAVARVVVSRSTIERTSGDALQATTNNSGEATIVLSGSMLAAVNQAWNVGGSGASIVSLGNNHITNYSTTTGGLSPDVLQ